MDRPFVESIAQLRAFMRQKDTSELKRILAPRLVCPALMLELLCLKTNLGVALTFDENCPPDALFLL